MTVSSATTKAGPYSGNGVTTVFAYGFKVFDAAELQVVLLDAAGQQTTLTLTTHYSVTGVGAAAGGTVVMVTAPAAGETLTIARNVALTQETDLRQQGGFYPEVHERVFDRLSMGLIQLRELIGRALRMPVVDASAPVELPPAATRANKVLVFDAAGAPGVTDVAGLASVTAASYVAVQEIVSTGASSYTLASAPGATAMIEVAVGGLVQSPAADYSLAGNQITFAGTVPPAGVRIIVRWIIAQTASQVSIANQVYTGSDANNLDFPIGTTLAVYTDVRVYARSASNAIRRSTANTYEFCDSVVSGTTLTGTWRARGTLSGLGFTLFERTA